MFRGTAVNRNNHLRLLNGYKTCRYIECLFLVELQVACEEVAFTALSLSRIIVDAINVIKLCNTFKKKVTMSANGDSEDVSVEESIEIILGEAKIARSNFDNIKYKFFEAMFNQYTKYDESMFSNNHYDWLHSQKAIPKELGQTVPCELLKSVTFQSVLPKLYSSLQVMELALDEVFKTEKYIEFKNLVIGYIKTLKEEVSDAMYYAEINPPSEITKDVIPHDFCDITHQTFLRIRDWIVFRECMNLIEYIVQAFSFLQQNVYVG